MNWFEEQIKEKKLKDEENFAEAIEIIGDALMDKKIISIESGDNVKNVIDEVLKYFNFRSKGEYTPLEDDSFEQVLDYWIRPFGLVYRNVELDDKWYKQTFGPMISSLNDSEEYIALIPDKVFGYSYIDPKTGRKIKVNKNTNKLINKEAYCFYKPLPLKSLTIADLLKFMISQLSTSDIIMYFAMMLLSILLGLISPYLTKLLFSDVLESGSIRVLAAMAIFMISFSISQLLFSSFSSLINNRFSIKREIAVEAAVMNRIMSLPATFYRKYSSGELSQRSSYVQSLCSTLFNTIGTTGLTSLFSLVYIGQIFIFAKELVIPSLIITITSIAFSLFLTSRQMKLSKERMEVDSKVNGLVYSTITGIQKIKLAGAEKRMFARWAKLYSKQARLNYNPPMLIKLSSAISMIITAVGELVIYYVAIKNAIGVANFYAFNAAYGMVAGALSSVASIASQLATIKPILDMARPIIECEPETGEGKQAVTSLNGSIDLHNISFRYDKNMPWVIDDLSLRIKPGEYVAIVGSTGCGKSTLLRLLLGFEKPQKGNIFYDNKNIENLDLTTLRKKIGTVTQDGKLFVGDIYSNIVISAPELTLNDAWNAAEIAQIKEDIEAMPMGMNTIISDGQGGISGGQRQRIMIARAIAPKPKILMFDEATSALDNLTQSKICKAIDELKCTRIVIAHRLSTIRHVDRIIYLDKGKIAEQGTYDELIAKNGKFAELIERQRLDVE